MEIKSEYLGDSAEFFITSELLLRGFVAQPTFGNKKKMDLIVRYVQDDAEKFKIIEVKSTLKKRKYAMIKGIPIKSTYKIIFADYFDKEISEKPDIYILSHSDWYELMKKLIVDEVEKCKISNRTRTTFRFKWIQEHQNCKVEKSEDREKIDYFVKDLETNESLHIASIRRTEGYVEWKNPDFSGIDVPIEAIRAYKDNWDKIKE